MFRRPAVPAAVLCLSLALPAWAATAPPADVIAALATTPIWTQNGTVVNARFGYSVSTAGDVDGDGYSDVIVGAPDAAGGGRAYLYRGTSNGLVSTAWNVGGLDPLSKFGWSVASAGDVNNDGYDDVIIGDPTVWQTPHPSEIYNAGRVYVFRGSAAGLTMSTSEVIYGSYYTGVKKRFGWSVAGAGDVNGDGFDDIMIGIPGDPLDPGNDDGAVLFHGKAQPLGGIAYSPADPIGYVQSGSSVAGLGDIDGDGYDDVLMGMPGNAPGDPGRAMIWYGAAAGVTFTGRQSLLTDPSGQVGTNFGASVAGVGDIDGDGYADFAIGAPGYDAGMSTAAGRMYVYRGRVDIPHSGVAAYQGAPVFTHTGAAFSQYGMTVAPAGDLDGDGRAEILAAYLPDFEASGVTHHVLTWSPNEFGNMAFLGSRVAPFLGPSAISAGDVNGDGFGDIVFGFPNFDPPGVLDGGKAEVCLGGPEPLARFPTVSILGGGPNEAVGSRVAPAGDVNGDGYADLLAAEPGMTSPTDPAYTGRVRLFLGGDPPSPVPVWTMGGSALNGTNFGFSLAAAGDVDGDGYDDILIGAPGPSPYVAPDVGRAVLWRGSPAGPSVGPPDRTYNGTGAYDGYGFSVAGAGDVNGDGFADFVIGCPYADDEVLGRADVGEVTLHLGSQSGPGPLPNLTWRGSETTALMGYALAGEIDVNGDGYDDVVFGAPLADPVIFVFGQPVGIVPDGGRVFLHHGGPAGPPLVASQRRDGEYDFASYGLRVAGVGDVDADGYGDVVVGEPYIDGSFGPNEGRFHLHRGSAAGMIALPAFIGTNGQANEQFGETVARAGDIDGDGYDDVIAGTPLMNNQFNDAGVIRVYRGGPNGLDPGVPFFYQGAEAGAQLGLSAAGPGDMNGDGFADVVIGTPFADLFAGSDAGRIDVFAGNGRFTPNRRTRMILPGSTSVLAAHNSIGLGEFALEHQVRSPRGGGDMRLRVEMADAGNPFAPADGVHHDTWHSFFASTLGTSAARITTREINPPFGNGPIHWRARLETRSPFFPRSPWYSLAAAAQRGNQILRGDMVWPGLDVDPTGGSGSLALRAWPNPSSGAVTLGFALAAPTQVRARIVDARGRIVRTLELGRLDGGPQVVRWDGRDASGRGTPAGVYLVQLSGPGVEINGRLVRVASVGAPD